MRYRVKEGHSIHSDKGQLLGGDTIPADWLPDEQREELVASGHLIEEPEEQAPAMATQEPARPARKGKS